MGTLTSIRWNALIYIPSHTSKFWGRKEMGAGQREWPAGDTGFVVRAQTLWSLGMACAIIILETFRVCASQKWTPCVSLQDEQPGACHCLVSLLPSVLIQHQLTQDEHQDLQGLTEAGAPATLDSGTG